MEKENIDDFEDKARDLVRTRQQAYHQVFKADDLGAQKVLDDLARFCRADRTTFHPDPRMHALIEGRREVYLRIKDHLTLQPHELEQKSLSKWGINGKRSSNADSSNNKFTSGTAEQYTDADASVTVD